jgi:hypothetical protein
LVLIEKALRPMRIDMTSAEKTKVLPGFKPSALGPKAIAPPLVLPLRPKMLIALQQQLKFSHCFV